MSSTYSGSPNLVTSITIPSDGDSATANSVNVSSKALFDMQSYLLQTYGQQQQSTSPIKIAKSGGGMTIYPIPLIIMTEAGVWKSYFKTTSTSAGAAKIEGGGAFAASTWYYLYAYSNAGSLDFQYSLTPPDSYNLYKNDGTFGFKFLASIWVDSLGQLANLTKYGNIATFTPNVVSLPGSGTATTTETAILLTSVIPPYKTTPTLIKLQVRVTGTTGIMNTIYIKSTAGSTGIPFSLGTSLGYTFQIDVLTDTAQKIYWQADFNDATTIISFNVVGYYE